MNDYICFSFRLFLSDVIIAWLTYEVMWFHLAPNCKLNIKIHGGISLRALIFHFFSLSLSLSLYIYIYIYIYVCVCVCVCVYVCVKERSHGNQFGIYAFNMTFSFLGNIIVNNCNYFLRSCHSKVIRNTEGYETLKRRKRKAFEVELIIVI